MIPNIYYKKELLSLIDAEIRDGVTSYNDIDDKDEIIVQCIAALGNDAYQCIIEEHGYANSVTHNLSTYLSKGGRSEAYNLAQGMRENALWYFCDVMNELFEERYARYIDDRNLDAGMTQIRDSINGELRWV